MSGPESEHYSAAKTVEAICRCGGGLILYMHGIIKKTMRAGKRFCATKKKVFSGTEIRKCNIRKVFSGAP